MQQHFSFLPFIFRLHFSPHKQEVQINIILAISYFVLSGIFLFTALSIAKEINLISRETYYQQAREFCFQKTVRKYFNTIFHHNYISCPQNLLGQLKVLISSNSGRIWNLIWIKVSAKCINVILTDFFFSVFKKRVTDEQICRPSYIYSNTFFHGK